MWDEPNDENVRVGVLEIGPGSTLTFVRTYKFAEVGGARPWVRSPEFRREISLCH